MNQTRTTQKYDYAKKRNVNVVNTYQTQDVQYMGKTIFSKEDLDIERIRRGWQLIFSKYCKGTSKAF
jgi:hypothetical protein